MNQEQATKSQVNCLRLQALRDHEVAETKHLIERIYTFTVIDVRM